MSKRPLSELSPAYRRAIERGIERGRAMKRWVVEDTSGELWGWGQSAAEALADARANCEETAEASYRANGMEYAELLDYLLTGLTAREE